MVTKYSTRLNEEDYFRPRHNSSKSVSCATEQIKEFAKLAAGGENTL